MAEMRHTRFALQYLSKRKPVEEIFQNVWPAEAKGSITTRGLLATDHVILNHGQVTWTTPELAPPSLTTTPHQREDVSALDRFNVHRCPTRWVFSGTGVPAQVSSTSLDHCSNLSGSSPKALV
ncbi:uncharacterized protein TNCV_2539711 [Trichonephila clavipes]|uniref:Uncharacterized protein n=1 Tax=Trichonephila clavipes TaxID=2585209 RepID=A0A8X6VGC5_TRICX|nr:uncharacterized protein TNCV_2539711 [Trichonephila clavipes]